MISIHLNLIQEIDHLWAPVYPYLARQIVELYGRQDGSILEIGPFCGVIFTLLEKNIGSSFSIATFPKGMDHFFREEVRKRKIEDKIEVIETDPSLTGIKENKIDLAIFRGAFFFPSLFEVNFSEIYRVLKAKGIAFIGGGFGKFTPDAVIKDIGKRSRDLNLQIGKIEVGEKKLRKDIQAGNVKGKAEVITEGGLWVLMKK
jgi:SAM-dependent methyltransferase